ncbi:hypothetical protein B0H16DRAFT_1698338 [Mycena metata]|uniref:Fungal-type protein kinase domain-containing protein n=1 Tax=Mycena metata TaxID=1033252 RepID=A0AAD7MNL8_9AGAR|nr:hypothetical protein B0H16DRAFT_1698338 [Mycena metata]
MLEDNFAGVLPVDDFFEKFLPLPDADASSKIDAIVIECSDELKDAKLAASKAWRTGKENDMAAAFIKYLEAIVSEFKEKDRKPFILDTHNTIFESLDEGDHYTKPDITCSRPGTTTAPRAWADAGTVIELKHKTDVFGEKKTKDSLEIHINDSLDSRHALVQLAKSARSLLMALNACHAFVVSVFGNGMARIFRFDHSSFWATEAFNWTTDHTVFPRFLFCLYPPKVPIGHMHGHDDTISLPTEEEKESMFELLHKHEFYRGMFKSQESATKESFWVTAVRFRDVGGKRVPEPVQCFTIGPALWTSDGLFSRATQVYRVILKEDLHMPLPPIYALKDVWRQACRRPEIDFYDVIAKYCEKHKLPTEGMAKCHGSLDLSVSTPTSDWEPTLHRTCLKPKDSSLERCHTRSLLTPIGSPLKSFPSTKTMVQAIYSAVLHHEMAYKAGVLHRDISDGNVLFQEGTEKGFLLDWDYAEFTQDGLASFNEWFPERKDERQQYEDINKSLKDMTGTLPFVSIQILKDIHHQVPHAPHHDLESIYWLLIWMILRYTEHIDPNGRNACGALFDARGHREKAGWLLDPSPVPLGPLFTLVDDLRNNVWLQNQPGPAVPLTHEMVLKCFNDGIQSNEWPVADAALEFVLPSQNPIKNAKAESLLRTAVENKSEKARVSQVGSAKRRRNHQDDEEDVNATGGSSAGSKDADISTRTRSASKKAKAK